MDTKLCKAIELTLDNTGERYKIETRAGSVRYIFFDGDRAIGYFTVTDDGYTKTLLTPYPKMSMAISSDDMSIQANRDWQTLTILGLSIDRARKINQQTLLQESPVWMPTLAAMEVPALNQEAETAATDAPAPKQETPATDAPAPTEESLYNRELMRQFYPDYTPQSAGQIIKGLPEAARKAKENLRRLTIQEIANTAMLSYDATQKHLKAMKDCGFREVNGVILPG